MFTFDVIKARNVHVERFYVIYHKFSRGAAFYTLNGKNVNVMLELVLMVRYGYQIFYVLIVTFLSIVRLCYSYNMVCPPVRGDNPRALASGLFPVQMDKP